MDQHRRRHWRAALAYLRGGLTITVRLATYLSLAHMRRRPSREPQVERRFVDPPVAANLESRKSATLDQSVNGRRMHAQYLGDLIDRKNTLDFCMSSPGAFHQVYYLPIS
jgi:hypothetical protein